MARLFYTRPNYLSSADLHEPRRFHYFLRAFSVVLAYLGFKLGTYEAAEENKLYKAAKMTSFESEDQIADLLYNKEKDAVFLMFYTPGTIEDLKFYNTFEKASASKEFRDIVFQVVHCRKHLNFCTNKFFKGRTAPMAELYYLNEQDKIELADMDRWMRS